MSKFDDQIEQALRDESNDVWTELEEQGMFEQAIGVMKGRQRFIAGLAYVFTFVFMGLMVMSAIRFFRAETTQDQIAWAVGFLFSNTAIGMLKIWFFIEMNRNTVIREVKRLELQVATLAGIIKQQGTD